MSAPLLMVLATLLFATMGVCVKLASAYYGAGEIVMYRGLVGTLFLFALSRAKGLSLKTSVPAMHFWRSLSGVIALSLWFFAISKLPLATAMTLNYMSSVWMALFLIGGAVLMGAAKVDPRLVVTFPVELPGGTTPEEVEQWLAASGFTRVQAEREVATPTGPRKVLDVVAASHCSISSGVVPAGSSTGKVTTRRGSPSRVRAISSA